MNCTNTFIPYAATGYFSKIVEDYLTGHDALRPFYAYSPNLEGIKQSVAARKNIATNRQLLVNVLLKQYASLTVSDQVNANIQLLSDNHVFTITTAHQPNIFTGPLYFIYKIMHTVKLAEELNKLYTDAKFVPVYYMGSEDADLEELGYVNVGGQKLIWNTAQTGAVGRMKIDKAFIGLIHTIEGQIAVQPNGSKLIELFKQCYTEGKMIQQATLELVNHLFSAYGVIVVIPDNPELKRSFQPVIEKELMEGFSHKIVEQTAAALSVNYKVQASGRAINLFYLKDDKRERIELGPDQQYQVQSLKLSFTKEEILAELANHPERFSANVILRGAFQETILPNVAFIGGGGELAYWLELKNVFKAINVHYPVLILRNSFLFVEPSQYEKLRKYQLLDEALFIKTQDFINNMVNDASTNQLQLAGEIKDMEALYNKLQNIAATIDATLMDHVISLKTHTLKKIQELEKKLLKAEKAKFQTAIDQINHLKLSLFPGNNLQERTDNFSLYYSKYGEKWMDIIYQFSRGIDQLFGVIYAD